MTRLSHRQGPTCDLLRLSGTDTTTFPYRRRRAALQSVFAAQQLSAPCAPCPSTTAARASAPCAHGSAPCTTRCRRQYAPPTLPLSSAANSALELSAQTSTLLHTDAAACSHHDGGSEQACRPTVAALTGLPDGYRTGLFRCRAQDLYETIPTQHHRERAVRQLRDVLAA
ncbi:DNA ligase-like domain-containing protein [Streptomyces massasporeus]|uniref:hypothetical protein n=1 Tax=Streptomyces massasporeus TaxID=67324 RepID=UPI00382A3887